MVAIQINNRLCIQHRGILNSHRLGKSIRDSYGGYGELRICIILSKDVKVTTPSFFVGLMEDILIICGGDMNKAYDRIHVINNSSFNYTKSLDEAINRYWYLK